MVRLKQHPEDFIVKEIFAIDRMITGSGSYSYYLMKKKSYNTVDAAAAVAKVFHLKPKYVNFCGNKDRNAVTEQYISVLGGPVRDLETKDISLRYLGRGNARLALGMLDGNHFEIVARDIDAPPQKITRIINYFDDQRFGTDRKNIRVGKHIIKKEFREALLLMGSKEAEQHLNDRPNDLVGAMKKVPKKLLLLYIHSFQSDIWNRSVETYLGSGGERDEMPLVGFNIGMDDKMIASVISGIIEDEGMTSDDFLIRQMPELTTDGDRRPIYAEVKDLEIGSLEHDELNPKKKKVMISFSLGKGSYATQVIKQMFQGQDVKQ